LFNAGDAPLQSLAADRAVPLGCALSLHGVLCCYL
jgi:hypothetical protein